MNFKILLAAACATTLAGCALTEAQIDVVHSAPAGVAKIPGAEASPVLVVVTDARTLDRSTVGNKTNGYGMQMAAIRLERGATDIVKEAVERELAARGFPARGDGEQVHVQIDTFYSSFQVGWWAGRAGADVDLTVWVTGRSGQILFKGRIEGHGVKTVELAGGASSRAALELALNDAMAKLAAAPGFMGALTSGA